MPFYGTIYKLRYGTIYKLRLYDLIVPLSCLWVGGGTEKDVRLIRTSVVKMIGVSFFHAGGNSD